MRQPMDGGQNLRASRRDGGEQRFAGEAEGVKNQRAN